MQSKAQQAALLRVEQLGFELRNAMKEIKFESEPPYQLQALEHRFEKSVEEVTRLVEEHCLDKVVLTKFTATLTEEIYDKAASLKCHAWQAQFAKKHSM